MKPVFAHFMLFVIVVIDAVHIGIVGHRRMERGIEYHCHFLALHDGTAGVDPQNRGRIVQRRKLGKRFEHLHGLVGDERGFRELFARSDDAMPHRVDFVHRFDDADLFIGQFFEHERNGVGVAFHFFFEHETFTPRFMRKFAARDADPLARTLCDRLFGLHVDKLIFERGTPRVDD